MCETAVGLRDAVIVGLVPTICRRFRFVSEKSPAAADPRDKPDDDGRSCFRQTRDKRLPCLEKSVPVVDLVEERENLARQTARLQQRRMALSLDRDRPAVGMPVRHLGQRGGREQFEFAPQITSIGKPRSASNSCQIAGSACRGRSYSASSRQRRIEIRGRACLFSSR